MAYLYQMKLIGFSVLLLFLCQSGEVEDLQSVYTDMNNAKLAFLPFPALKDATTDIKPIHVLHRGAKVVPLLGDTLTLFKVLTRNMFHDSKKVKELHPCDLNADGLQDMLVLATRAPGKGESTSKEEPVEFRRVILFLKRKNGGYLFVTSNDHVVDDPQSGGAGLGDSYRSIHVSKGKMVFKSIHGSCDRTLITTTYVFDQPRQYWYLKTKLNEKYNCNQNPSDAIEIHRKLQTVNDFGDVKF